MRVKTDARRQAILNAATAVFQEMGYEGASMSVIAQRAGGSKATLYGYFKSKEELFAEAMLGAVEDHAQEMMSLLDAGDPDVRRVLKRFGAAYLRFLSNKDTMDIIRTCIAEGRNPTLGPLLFEHGPKRAWRDIADYLTPLLEQKRLRSAEPDLAATHLKGLLEAGIMEPCLFGAQPQFDLDAAADAAVEAFLRAYRPE